ncbi:MAG: hypothetical protein ABIH46_12250, partial [Chloroflexota bacterium]
SLGWGIQSFALAAMSALGEMPPVDYAIHADTTHEISGTYEHAAKWTPWLESHGVKVVTVRASQPNVLRRGGVSIPAYTINGTGKSGQTKRQCTHDWKMSPIRRFIRSIIGKPTPGAVEMVMGISLDEYARQRSSDVQYIENAYPLVDSRITRADCIEWLERQGLDVPPKSACSFCPYHNRGAWRELKRAGGLDWERALSVDEVIRDRRPPYQLFVHPARLPLAHAVSIPEDEGARQMELDEVPCDGGVCFV